MRPLTTDTPPSAWSAAARTRCAHDSFASVGTMASWMEGILAGVDRGFGREAEGAGPAALTAETHQIVDVREWPVDGRDSGERGRVDHAGARIEQGVPG